MKLGTWLLSLAQPMLAKILLALGFSVVSIVGMESVINQVRDMLAAGIFGLSPDTLNLFLLAGGGRQMVRKGNNTGFGAGALLVAHVDLRGRVFAHKNNRKARSTMALGTGGGHFRAKFRPDVGGGFFAVNQDHVKLQKIR